MRMERDQPNDLRRLSGRCCLRAIRESLVLLMPVVMAGALATLLGSFPFASVLPPAWAASVEPWSALAMHVAQASSGIVSLCLLVLVSHFLAVDARQGMALEVSPQITAVLALVNFFVIMRVPGTPPAQWLLGPQNVLPAILVAIIGSVLFFALSRTRWLRFGLTSYYLDPSLHLALTAIGPALATVAFFALMSLLGQYVACDPGLWVARAVTEINQACGSGLPGLLLLGALNQLLWFVGVHGPHLLEGTINTLLALPASTTLMPGVSKRFFDLYVHLGGSGSTLGLLLAIVYLRRSGEGVRVARYALLPSVFNINEPLIFGLPIIFNPIYLLPFVAAPLTQIVLTWLCLRQGWIVLDTTLVPWMTPPLLSGTLNSGNWHGGAVQSVCIGVSALIYAPFVSLAARRRISERRSAIAGLVADIERIKDQQASVLDRYDDVGHAARKLLHEFVADLGSDSVSLAYQPQHDTRGRVVGVEALLRWQHRNLGPISPAVICALLEESRDIVRLGRWAISRACRQLHDWQRAGIENLRVSINVSPIQLRDLGLCAYLAASLAEYGLNADAICIELTESQRVPDDAVSLETLRGLEQLGVHLEMDDFGMGYSSMLYIRRFRFAAIKLDGVLTRDVVRDKNCRDIIATVVRLGEASGLRVVAEYVEDGEQLRVLADLGCCAFQGYLYSPALAPSACLDYLRASAIALPVCKN